MNFVIKANSKGLWDVKKRKVGRRDSRKAVFTTINSFQNEIQAVEFAKKEFERYSFGVISVYDNTSKLPRVLVNKPRQRDNHRAVKDINYGSSINPELLESAIVKVVIGP